MTSDVISRLADPAVESKIELVHFLIERLDRNQTNGVFRRPIDDYLSEKEKFGHWGHYCMVGPKYALGSLVGNFLFHWVDEEDSIKQKDSLNGLLNFLKGFRHSTNPVLKQTVAGKLLDLTLHKFGIPGHFLRTSNWRPLRICFIPYEHADVNGGYYPEINTIVSYKPRKKDLDPAYIFVHELGHLLTYNLTGEHQKVPESFVEFSNKIDPARQKSLVELFVDLFSVAVMTNTLYADKNPLINAISPDEQKIVREYFIRLMKSPRYKKVVPFDFDI